MRYHHEGTSSPQSARFGQNTASFSGRSRMKKLMLLIIALAALPGGALFAQDITGTWQGTLLAGKQELRTVVKVSKADGGGLKAVFYSIDQSGQGVAGSVTVQGSTVKISIPGIGGTYEGKVNADGASITGIWTREAHRRVGKECRSQWSP